MFQTKQQIISVSCMVVRFWVYDFKGKLVCAFGVVERNFILVSCVYSCFYMFLYFEILMRTASMTCLVIGAHAFDFAPLTCVAIVTISCVKELCVVCVISYVWPIWAFITIMRQQQFAKYHFEAKGRFTFDHTDLRKRSVIGLGPVVAVCSLKRVELVQWSN